MSPISIMSYSSISPLGSERTEIWKNYLSNKHFLNKLEDNTYLGSLMESSDALLECVVKSDSKYKSIDKSVLMAIFSSRQAIEGAQWKEDEIFGINIGSSRGATELFENYYQDFINHQKKKTHPLTSPTTTMGNLSTWVAHDLQSKGPVISHSITCSTALHAILNGVAWLNSGMSDKFLVGGTEAANTRFTIAQMRAIKIYTDLKGEYPSRSLDLKKSQNTMCLGEGAAVFCLEKGEKKNAKAFIESVGYATEILQHNISITDDALCFQDSMRMALEKVEGNIDVIVTHTPGTIKGDLSEYRAIERVFANKVPSLTSNKWKIGHTLGASGALSMELALLMIEHQEFIEIPFIENTNSPSKIDRIMVNAVGFGGNAVSIVLKRNKELS